MHQLREEVTSARVVRFVTIFSSYVYILYFVSTFLPFCYRQHFFRPYLNYGKLGYTIAGSKDKRLVRKPLKYSLPKLFVRAFCLSFFQIRRAKFYPLKTTRIVSGLSYYNAEVQCTGKKRFVSSRMTSSNFIWMDAYFSSPSGSVFGKRCQFYWPCCDETVWKV